MIVGQVVSLMTGGAGQKIDEHLLVPFFQSPAFKEQMQRKSNATKYAAIDLLLLETARKRTTNYANETENEAITVAEIDDRSAVN